MKPLVGFYLAAFLSSCSSPDEISVAANAGETRYPSTTNIWDSRNYGGEIRAAWDLGQRSRAHEAQIRLLELEERVAERTSSAPAPVVVAEPVYGPPAPEIKPEATESSARRDLFLALATLATAISGWLGRRHIKRTVSKVSAKVRDHVGRHKKDAHPD